MSVQNRISLFCPEHLILKTVNDILTIIRSDYRNKILEGREEENMLYLLLYGQTVGKHNLYQEAVSIFITTAQNPKHFDCKLNYDQNSTNAPQIYITQPSENERNNSIGLGEGDQDELVLTRDDEADQYREQYRRRYLATHYVVIVCENRMEMTIIYNVLKSMIASCMNHFALEGLSNLKLGGQELKLRSEIPDKLFQKGIVMSFEYEQVSPSIVIKEIFRKISIFWRPVEADTSQGPITVETDDDLNESSS